MFRPQARRADPSGRRRAHYSFLHVQLTTRVALYPIPYSTQLLVDFVPAIRRLFAVCSGEDTNE